MFLVECSKRNGAVGAYLLPRRRIAPVFIRSSVHREDQRNCRVPYERFFYPTGAEKQPVSEEEEAIYSEADDGKPKPIPVAEFPKYFKKKSENGAIVLREEFKVIIYYSFYFFPFLSYYRIIV